MNNTQNENEIRDDKLWRIAKKRAAFKMLLMVYILVNCMLVALWCFTNGVKSYFWPMWPILGWGLGILYQFVDAYMGNTVFSDEKEFERLKRKK